MNKEIINTQQAPAPIGPYNQAVKSNGMLYISGQIALVPGTDELLTHDLVEETKQVMQNLKAILHAAQIDFSHAVKTSIFLSDMKHFATVNEVYASYFQDHYPARETVHVSGLPKGVNVEISMIATLQ
ncbi:MAG: RidA family protein [Chitinophagaceae bacterium]